MKKKRKKNLNDRGFFLSLSLSLVY